MTAAARKVIPFRQAPKLDQAYRAQISIHHPNSDELAMQIRVDLMALRDRASMALNRCCEEAAPALAEAARLAGVAALSNQPTRTLAFVRGAVDSLIFAATMLERGVR